MEMFSTGAQFMFQALHPDPALRIEIPRLRAALPLSRHLSIECKLKQNKLLKQKKLMELRKYKKLHSIIVHNIRGFKAIESWFSEFKNVYSLTLANCNIKKLPENIGNLKHLRFFDISRTKIEQLPNSFCNLYKLEFLNMEHCDDFQFFPEGSNRLISIKILLLPEKKLSLVGHIQNLANAIQQLVLFTVGKEEGSTIGVLKHMNRICGSMKIKNLDDVSSKNEAEQAQLNNKEFVESLHLVWNHADRNLPKNDTHTEVIEGLCPHSNLKRLEISHYRGEILPSWLKKDTLPNLTVIVLRGCKQIKNIPNCLPSSITELTIYYCLGLLSLQNCLVPSNLPSLKKISIEGCDELVSMPVETFHDFVFLQELTISYCPELRCSSEMVLPPSLRELYLESCGELEKRLSSSMRNLTSLTRLTIKNCRCLTSIPPHVISDLKSLEYLKVFDCPALQSIGGLEFLESVKEVDIRCCAKLKETKGKNCIRTRREA